MNFEQSTANTSSRREWVNRLILACLLLSLTFRTWSFFDEFDFRTFSFGLEWLRAHGYEVSGSLIGLLAIVLISQLRLEDLRIWWSSVFLQLALILILRLKLYSYGVVSANVLQSVALSGAVIVCFTIIVPSAISARVMTFRTLAIAVFTGGILWAGLSLNEWRINEASAVWMDRFLGISGHPNHAGVIAALSAIAGGGLFRQMQKTKARMAVAMVIALLISIVIWTGSRTALLVAVVGFTCLLLRRSFAVLLVGCAIFSAAAIVVKDVYINGMDEIGELRAFSTANTRQETWETLWREFSENWLLGGDPLNTPSENSLLLVLARTGIVGGSIFILSMTLAFRDSFRLLGCPSSHNEYHLVKAAGAMLMAILAGGVFEGFLRDEFSFPIFTFYLVLASAAATKAVRFPLGVNAPMTNPNLFSRNRV